MTFTSVTTHIASYKIINEQVDIQIRCDGTTGGTASTTLIATLPFTAMAYGSNPGFGCSIVDTSAMSGFSFITASTANIGFRRYDNANFALAAGKSGQWSGFYSI